ncbi:MAG: hypothetical protein IJN75_02745 [Clostridia bacterium]|nr:hypothetical protein [Clostridia bacterium]
MKYNTSKHVVSILLILVMIVGILPITAFAEEVYTKLGEIPTVTVNAELNPTVGGKNKPIDLIEITSPVDQGVSVSGYWQKWNEEKQKWEQYGRVPHPTMEEGTYRMYVQLRTESNDANEYYALTANTSLYVNDVKWTKDPDYSVLSYSNGYGYIYFYSPEFVLTKDGENSGGKLTGLKLKTSPSKTEYIEGEYFDTTGMEVYACYDNSETIIVKDYFVVNGLSLVEEQNSVTISYTKGTETVKLDVPITVGDELEDEKVFEVYSWSDFEEAFYYSDNRGESYTIKLMKSLTYMAEDAKRSATALVEVQVLGCNVTLDFNGYTLKCYDNVSTTDLSSALSDFIRIGLRSRYGTPIELRLTDSKGGGGIYMESDRAYDNQLAALHIVDMRCYVIDGIYQTCAPCNKLTIDGGNYRLSATTQKIGSGTINPNVFYRGTVIADTFAQGAIVINGGKFEAKSNGRYYDGDDFCARELSAFATCSNAKDNICGVEEAHTIINGGMFISDGYAIHHFDHSLDTDETRSMRFPKIYGGVFLGSIGYIGMSFTYDNWDCTGLGVDEYKERAASTIVNPSTLFVYIKGGKMLKQTDGLTLLDLHEADSVYVINESLLKLKTIPVTNGFKALERYVGQTETFKLDYTVPYGLDEFIYTPYISVTPNGGATTTENVTEKTIDYKDYPNGLDVVVGLKVKIPTVNEEQYFMSIYSIDVSEVPAAPEILAQPYSMTVGVGECAEAMVVANNAASYQWYYLYNGSYPMKLTDSFVGITGYTSPRLSVTLNGVGREYFYCVVTGTDGSTVKTNTISFTFGEMPSEKSFGGGEIRANGDAEFKLWAKYADVIKWVVVKRRSGSTDIYTLEKFAEETGCEYGTTHRDYATGLHSASVLFKNVDESWAGKYYIGYTLENSLGKVELDLDNLLPFEAYVNRPVIKKFIEEQSCFIGEDMTFSFEADNMTSAEWYFEKADEDGIMIVYTLDELRTLFPNTTFETAFYGDEATMTISNADLGLCEYVICPTAVNSTAAASAGTAQIYVMTSVDDATPIKISKQPTNVYVANGEKAETTVIATGEGLTYTWYYTLDKNGVEFYKSSVTGATYSTTMNTARTGRKVYCVITDKYGNSVTTDTAVLSLPSSIMIISQPKSASASNGSKITTTVAATGDGLTYTWYFTSNKAGVEFFVSSVTSATYSTTMDSTRDGRKVYCVITDKNGNTATTDVVTLTMK